MKRTDLADSTRGKYEGLLRLHILPTFGKVQLYKLAGAASMVRAWYYELDRRYPDGSTANDAYRCLRAIVNTAVADSRMSKSPCTVQGAGTTEAAERPVAALAELDAAVAAFATRYKAGYAIAAWCQLRRGEILGLRRMDIDLKGEVLQVRLDWVMPPGATRPVLKEPKSDAGKRPVAIPSHIMPLIEAHLERYVGPAPTAWLYGTKNGKPMLPRNFHRAWQQARQAVGRPDLSLHDLRAHRAHVVSCHGRADPRAHASRWSRQSSCRGPLPARRRGVEPSPGGCVVEDGSRRQLLSYVGLDN